MMLKEKCRAALRRFSELAAENKWLIAVLVLLFAERVFVMLRMGVEFNLGSDDYTYVLSGIDFANTGRIMLHSIPTAQIMPGMPVLIGIFSLIFGEGTALWVAIKLFWIFMGLGSAYFTYRTISIYVPKWCGLVCALVFYAMPQVVLLDNVILTETPFMLMLNIMLYSTFMLGRTKKNRYFIMLLLSYFGAYMMKATIVAYPAFAILYLLVQGVDRKKLVRQAAALVLVLVCFTVPWTVRNYVIFDRVIPVTYGAGDALLLGTYQGVNYPTDEELDYENEVYVPMREKFADLYDENGEIPEPHIAKFVRMELYAAKARYRMSAWWEKDTVNMVLSYLFYKPAFMLVTPFYWVDVMGVPVSVIVLFRSLIVASAVIITLLSIGMRKYRMPILSLALLFAAFIYMHAMSFAYGRYAETLMPMLYIICGIGLHFVTEWIKEKRLAKKTMKESGKN